MRNTEYKIVKEYIDKNRWFYLVMVKTDYGSIFKNWWYNSGWRYVNSIGKTALGRGGAYFSLDMEDCKVFIKNIEAGLL